MTGLAYLATGPAGTRFSAVRLRLHAQRLRNHPDQERLKVVVQVHGIPEDPIYTDFMTPLELAFLVSDSRREGWEMEGAA
jgi:hypothetical protein